MYSFWQRKYCLPHHNSFSYINNGSLTNEYFYTAEESLNDGYFYLVITKSKSPSSEVSALFTNRPYNHVSISFDRELRTIIGYNGGDKLEPPALNPEILKGLTKRNGSTNYFEKAKTHVQPADFVELDYYRNLEFIAEITVDKAISNNGDYAYGETNP